MSKYSVEVALVVALVVDAGFSEGVASLVGEQLSTHLGRMEARAVAARKDGRLAVFGKVDGHANADLKFLALKAAKSDTNYLPCRLLVVADAAATFAKAAGLRREDVSFKLPDSTLAILAGMEVAGKEREASIAAKRKEREDVEKAIAARQELAARLLADHDAQEEQRKVKSAKQAAPVAA